MTRLVRAGIYARISRDRDNDEQGVGRQLKNCRRLIERNGWELAGEWVDNDLTAYAGKHRPAYVALCEAIRDREITTVVVGHTDRLHRHPRELEDWIDLLESTGCHVESVHSGRLDFTTSDGRFRARIEGTVARKASEDTSRRIVDKLEELAEQGKPKGGPRSFGFEPDGMTLRSDEAELIRSAAAHVLAGGSAWSMAEEWNERRIPTARGAKRWSVTVVKGVLTSPRTAGKRVHRGEIIGDAAWPAIVDEHTWHRLRQRLNNRPKRRPSRGYLLTGGLAFCELCGEPLHASPKSKDRWKQRAYGCLKIKGGCGGINILAHILEPFVSEMVAAALEEPDLAAALNTPPAEDHADELAAQEDRLAELAEMWAGGEISRAEWTRARDRIRNTQAELQAKVRPITRALDAADLPALYRSGTLEHRRSVIEAVVDRVIVRPAFQNGTRLGVHEDPEQSRVWIRWRA